MRRLTNRTLFRLGSVVIMLWAGFGGSDRRARAGLAEYLKKPDPSFAWKATGEIARGEGTIHEIALTSQTWRGIVWKHKLRVYEPKTIAHGASMLLLIAGGDHDSVADEADEQAGFALAKLCGACCAVLPQTPNQPLFGGKTEDALIAETFVRYLETGEDEWPLLFPMVKGAVRAMDALQAWSKSKGKPAVESFVVTGASKRGWTTWLTGSQDARVIGIAPMVIDTLNMREQNKHTLEVWGKPSEQIHDYQERGLLSTEETPDRLRLWRMVDPYTYRDRLTLPKLIINGANDRYWTLDALSLYWDGLSGSKSVVYLPNAGHGLEQHRDYALHALGAFFRRLTRNEGWPELTWGFSATPEGIRRLEVKASVRPKSARVWLIESPTLDFREAKWHSEPLEAAPEGGFRFEAPAKAAVCSAFFGDLEFESPGGAFHLSTAPHQWKGPGVK